MSGGKTNIFEQTRAEIWFFFTQNLGCCLIGQLHVYNFIRQVWLMLQNSYCCKFSWISDTNYLNFRHLWIRHRLLFYRHYYILYRHILFILSGANRVKRFSIAENTHTKRYCNWWSPAQNVNVERVGRISSHIAVEEKSQGHRFLKQCGRMRPRIANLNSHNFHFH